MKHHLILLHGALGSSAQFDSLVEFLTLAFDTVHSFSFTGHGGKASGEEFSIELFVNDLLMYMNDHQIDRADIFGHSMGGYVALQMARDHASRARKIMTLGTKFDWRKETAAKEIRQLNPELIEEKVPSFAESLAKRHFPEDWKQVVRKTAAMMVNLGDGSAMGLADFRQIQTEVIVCLGSEDNFVTREESIEVANLIPNARFQIISGFKHPIETVDKVELTNLIVQFLKHGLT